jgi:hypothetical protein
MPIQPTAFGARDRGDFNVFLCCAPGGRRLMGRPFGRTPLVHPYTSA